MTGDYAGIDCAGRPVHEGDLVLWRERAWRVGTHTIESIAGSTVVFQDTVGLANTERMRER
jgi:hypothetical protein